MEGWWRAGPRVQAGQVPVPYARPACFLFLVVGPARLVRWAERLWSTRPVRSVPYIQPTLAPRTQLPLVSGNKLFDLFGYFIMRMRMRDKLNLLHGLVHKICTMYIMLYTVTSSWILAWLAGVLPTSLVISNLWCRRLSACSISNLCVCLYLDSQASEAFDLLFSMRCGQGPPSPTRNIFTFTWIHRWVRRLISSSLWDVDRDDPHPLTAPSPLPGFTGVWGVWSPLLYEVWTGTTHTHPQYLHLTSPLLSAAIRSPINFVQIRAFLLLVQCYLFGCYCLVTYLKYTVITYTFLEQGTVLNHVIFTKNCKNDGIFY